MGVDVGVGISVGVDVGTSAGVSVGVARGFEEADWAVAGLPQETRKALTRSITPNKASRRTHDGTKAERAFFSRECHIYTFPKEIKYCKREIR